MSLFGSAENNSIPSQNGSLSFCKFKSLKHTIKRNLIKSTFTTLFPNLRLSNLKSSLKKQLLLPYQKIQNHFLTNLLSNKNLNSKKSTCLENVGIVFKLKAVLLSASIHGFNKTEMVSSLISWIKCILVYKADSMTTWLNRKLKIFKSLKLILTKILTKKGKRKEKRKALILKTIKLNKVIIRKHIQMRRLLKENKASKRLKSKNQILKKLKRKNQISFIKNNN